MIITIVCFLLTLAVIGLAYLVVDRRMDLQDSRAGRIAALQADRRAIMEADLVAIQREMGQLSAGISYLVDIEKQRQENTVAAERAIESLEEEVAQTLSAANQHMAFRTRAFEERRAAFEESFLNPKSDLGQHTIPTVEPIEPKEAETT